MSNKTGQQLFNEHIERLKKAISTQKTDRPPIVLNVDAFALRYMGEKLSAIIKDPEYGNELILKAILKLGDGEVDGTGMVPVFPSNNGIFSLAKIKLPGRELPEDMLWQVDEVGYMTEEDYDVIIDKGWSFYFADYANKYLGNALEEMGKNMSLAPRIQEKFKDAGVVALSTGAGAGAPFGSLCAARGIARFMRDLHRIPDKVLAAMDVMMEETVQNIKNNLTSAPDFAVFTGGAREAGDFLSYKDFEKFAWSYTKKAIHLMAETGKYIYLHLDMNWDRFVKYFLELPKGVCIFHTDSTTDIFKAHEVLAGHMCFMGNVSPSLLTLASPDEVYAYSRRLVDEFLPQGLIMAAGCSIPANAKPENVQAMVDAALGR
ncbi:MAG: uroporphyrinogen decarboxylase family protein [Clostridiales bacterium]|jgi:uroporphyrinogen decarboxylase|nr:uroporphyrinogen-III decarboxylase [Eubacteriales bacterium]MDH7567685.1 uroporphyrinogen decarboxylase family protein [Clostridiales bacterium]